jgi:hypothetical protein
MNAYIEISNLIAHYAELMDAGEFEAIADLFADTTISVEGVEGSVQGRDTILAAYQGASKIYEDGTPSTKHVITNLLIEVDEAAGTAQARSYFTVLQAVPDVLGLQPILAGRYRDTFVLVDGKWRKATMHVIWDLIGDLSSHLKVDLM